MSMEGPATPPTNTRLIRPDGTVLPLELLYEGEVEGIHRWRTAAQIWWTEEDRLAVDAMPPQTMIVLDLLNPPQPEIEP